MTLAARWAAELGRLREQGRYRELTPPAGLDFTSNDYLGYANRRLPSTLPVSGTASRLLRPHAIWAEVEAALAAWHGADAVVMFGSGYAANEGLLSAIVTPRDRVFADRLNHACIWDGIRLARPRHVHRFRHNDRNQLSEELRHAAIDRRPGEAWFVVTESLFSMDGDRAPLAEMGELAERHDANLIVDEAHATGCFGSTGGGLVDAAGVRNRCLATVHTGGKALGVCGAYIVGSRLLREYLMNRCRHLMFTTALPPAVGEWWRAALDRVRSDVVGRERLHRNAATLRDDLKRYGVETIGSDYVVPIVLGEDTRAVAAAGHVQRTGFDVRAVRPPTVPDGTARLRVSVHADHTPEQLAALAAVIAEAVRA